jgi:hypothetical protein
MFGFSAKRWNCTAKIFCGLCVVFMLIGSGFGIYRWTYLKKAVVTEATITNLIERESDDGNTLYAPVYVFKDKKGNEVKIISPTASWPPVGEIGDPIEVLYLPSDPQRSIQNRFFSKWGFPAIFGGLGLIYFIVFALVVYFTGRHIKNKSEQGSAHQSTT